jgi:hypothetical protein
MKDLWKLMKIFAGIFVDISPTNQPISNAAVAEEKLNRFALSTWIVMLAGIVILFGFENEQVEPVVRRIFGKECHVNNYACWELGALVWNAVFAIYFYLKVPTTDNLLVEKFTPLAVLVGVGGFTFMALRTLVLADDPGQHVFYVLLIGIVFLIVDMIHARKQKEARDRFEFVQCLLLADLPTVPALAVLYYFQQSRPGELDKLDIFLSGAISFQLIASTLIFACIQAGVFNKVFGGYRETGHNVAGVAVGGGA